MVVGHMLAALHTAFPAIVDADGQVQNKQPESRNPLLSAVINALVGIMTGTRPHSSRSVMEEHLQGEAGLTAVCPS